MRKNILIDSVREQIGDWNKVLNFFDEVALLLLYDNVDITDF